MAEVIISDEEATRCHRLQSGISCFMNKNAYEYSTTCLYCSESKSAYSRDHMYYDRKNSRSIQRVKLCSKSTPPRACQKSNNTLIDKSHISSYINEIQYKDIQLYNALFFKHSVHVYKELFRLDLGISPEEQWKTVLEIFIDLLVPQFKRVGFLLAKTFEEKVSSEGSDIILFSCNTENKVITGLNDRDGCSDSRNDISCLNGDRGGNNCSRIRNDPLDDKAESIKSSRLDSLNSTTCIDSRLPVDVWKIIPSEVMTRLYHKALSQISKCDPIKEDKKNQKNGDDTGYSRTPSTGGGESSSFGVFFGVESLSNPSVTFASSSSHSLWNWTSRALRLTETGNDDDNDSHSYRNSYWDGDVGEGNTAALKGGRYENGTISNNNLKDDHTESYNNNDCGAYIFLPNSNGVEDTYYLKDRYIRPDLTLFDELCDELKVAINTS
eukprot:CAMPEP_0119037788 /NCGR_PEP_ID=MMETSP1177-20130426/6296_1 /TAXON_ID=2985 /ORGANISM="Ochromonas sp, Strain CCMP1899" /LENGTH=438 /DNA_ID=CAMNT_0006999477 /DNA_START=917 /DNA_END=2233 /DNA_ORIENTATION=+